MSHSWFCCRRRRRPPKDDLVREGFPRCEFQCRVCSPTPPSFLLLPRSCGDEEEEEAEEEKEESECDADNDETCNRLVPNAKRGSLALVVPQPIFLSLDVE